MVETILCILLAVAIAGGIGFVVSYLFYSSDLAKDKGSDFGPRGGILCFGSGITAGMFFFVYLGKYFFSPHAVGVGMLSSCVIGTVAGWLGIVQGEKRNRNDDGEK